MNKLSLVRTISVGIFFLSCGIFAILLLQKSQIDTKSPLPVKPVNTEITGLVAYWDEQEAWEVFPDIITKIDTFSPLFYKVMPDSSLGTHTVKNRDSFLQTARDSGVLIDPMLTDEGEYERITNLLSNRQIQEEFIQELVDEAKKENFGGWTIDIEKLRSSDKRAFSTFIQNLAVKLHQNDLRLNVIVFAKEENESYDPALAHDYSAIGRYADEVQLMTHGYSNESTNPGGQAPLSWYRSVLSRATDSIPGEKLSVSLSTHGYDWGNTSPGWLTYPQIKEKVAENNLTISYNTEESAAVATNGDDYNIWYEDAKTVAEKMNIAKNEFGIYKFSIWRIGAEDPAIWDSL